MISVSDALNLLLDLVEPKAAELVPLTQAVGRTLAENVTTSRTQPPFAASAMDGYAIAGDEPQLGQQFEVIGTSAAGHDSGMEVSSGTAIRIFTGAVVPAGAERVIIQEDVTRDGDTITVTAAAGANTHIRPAGADFKSGATLNAPRLLTPNDVALLAAMNVAVVPVTRTPSVAIITTGDELVMPGESPKPDQIIASNCFGLKALLETHGADVRLLPIARDTLSSLETAFSLAKGADLVISIGGASVGDHDLVAPAAERAGLKQSFYKVAMRPGKPLMAGRLGEAAMIGLPGNPVSAMVCGQIFVLPVLQKMLGQPTGPRTRQTAPLAAPLGQNGPREHYMRGRLEDGGLNAFDRQDSSLLSVLAEANVLIVRPPHESEKAVGEPVEYLPLI